MNRDVVSVVSIMSTRRCNQLAPKDIREEHNLKHNYSFSTTQGLDILYRFSSLSLLLFIFVIIFRVKRPTAVRNVGQDSPTETD